MMRCQACGRENRDGQKYCSECGALLAGSEEVLPTAEEEADPQNGPALRQDSDQKLMPRQEPAPKPPEPQNVPARRARPHTTAIVAASVALAVVAGVALFASGWLLGRASFSLSDIPDEAFRAYLQANVDLNADGSISSDEAEAVTSMGDPSQADDAGNGLSGLGITSLEGIERFANLQNLVCSKNDIPTIDLSQNTRLEHLVCNDSKVSEIVLPQGDALHSVHASGNNLSGVDVSGNPNLGDVQFDVGVELGGEEFSDEEAKGSIRDLALLYAFSRGTTPAATLREGGDLLEGPGDATLDAMLITTAAYPYYLRDSGFSIDEDTYGVAAEPTSDHAFGFVSQDTARTLLSSVYGDAPDDLGYLGVIGTDIGLGTLSPTDGGWLMALLDGPFEQRIFIKNWKHVGRLVSFDATLSGYNSADVQSGTGSVFHMVVAPDEDSIFGYHLVSVNEVNTITTTEEKVAEARFEDAFVIDGGGYTLTLPTYWTGRAAWYVYDGIASVYAIYGGSIELMRCGLSNTGMYSGGSIEDSLICAVPVREGVDLTVYASPYSLVIPYYNNLDPSDTGVYYSQEEAQELIDLQTGGTYSYDEVCEAYDVSGGESEANRASYAWMSENLPPCIVAGNAGAGDVSEAADDVDAEQGLAREAGEAPSGDAAGDSGDSGGDTPMGLDVSEDAFVATVRQSLNVPADCPVRYEIDGPHLWEGTGATYFNIAFYLDDELVASAGCDASGNPINSILSFSS